MHDEYIFKLCPMCEYKWRSRDDFINDSNIQIIGYQVHFDKLTEGLFMFNHSCGGTLSLAVRYFKDLYDGPVFQLRATGTEDCPGNCLHEDDLSPCPARCECAFVREIIQIIKKKNNKMLI